MSFLKFGVPLSEAHGRSPSTIAEVAAMAAQAARRSVEALQASALKTSRHRKNKFEAPRSSALQDHFSLSQSYKENDDVNRASNSSPASTVQKVSVPMDRKASKTSVADKVQAPAPFAVLAPKAVLESELQPLSSSGPPSRLGELLRNTADASVGRRRSATTSSKPLPNAVAATRDEIKADRLKIQEAEKTEKEEKAKQAKQKAEEKKIAKAALRVASVEKSPKRVLSIDSLAELVKSTLKAPEAPPLFAEGASMLATCLAESVAPELPEPTAKASVKPAPQRARGPRKPSALEVATQRAQAAEERLAAAEAAREAEMRRAEAAEKRLTAVREELELLRRESMKQERKGRAPEPPELKEKQEVRRRRTSKCSEQAPHAESSSTGLAPRELVRDALRTVLGLASSTQTAAPHQGPSQQASGAGTATTEVRRRRCSKTRDERLTQAMSSVPEAPTKADPRRPLSGSGKRPAQALEAACVVAPAAKKAKTASATATLQAPKRGGRGIAAVETAVVACLSKQASR